MKAISGGGGGGVSILEMGTGYVLWLNENRIGEVTA